MSSSLRRRALPLVVVMSGEVATSEIQVAARNHAAYEWIHHEHVGRSHGLTTSQLWAIRDTIHPPQLNVLSPLYSAALAFADHSTVHVKVPQDVMSDLQQHLQPLASSVNLDVADLLVEAAAVVATYNMVSRFLVSLDIAGSSDDVVPWPVDSTEHTIELAPNVNIHAITLVTHPNAPWIAFSNSLLTDEGMWEWIVPHIIAPAVSPELASSVSAAPCTIPLLAHDLAHLISILIPSGKVKCVIGVSQGGAAALAFGALYPTLTEGVISCDTGPKTAPGNAEAWQERIALAKTKGIEELASVTVDRWFPSPSKCGQGGSRYGRTETIKKMIATTSIPAFELGAGALMSYDLLKPLSEDGVDLLHSDVKTKVLLVAGELDGGGKVAAGMKGLREKWLEATPAAKVDWPRLPGAGHLPMIDETEKYWEVVSAFLKGL
ncbi:AB hydrolase-1 domain-containing protein [Mycena indigotica]|uniref:AB hydrolase-1 domain-containing protein n=1 Tax=Mycena indigotica TaxID=2126181 RepID=A0A8H6SBA9_9AGAR|nr:AB hydrolase-1 domain-containing protein [Mycena indigotica]KAF7295605.1 AB hydrolase-1 domain-containing protein [Mycena indigotica]